MNEQPTVNERAEMDARNSAIIQQLQVYLDEHRQFNGDIVIDLTSRNQEN